jgi:hypothetical protein
MCRGPSDGMTDRGIRDTSHNRGCKPLLQFKGTVESKLLISTTQIICSSIFIYIMASEIKHSLTQIYPASNSNVSITITFSIEINLIYSGTGQLNTSLIFLFSALNLTNSMELRTTREATRC